MNFSENREGNVSNYMVNIKAVLDDESLTDIAEKIYDKIKEKLVEDLMSIKRN